MRPGDVPGPDPGRQPEFGVVRGGDRTVRHTERQRRHDRAEDLLPHDAHVVADIDQHGRLDVVPGVADAPAAGQGPRTVGPPLIEVTGHPVQLLLGHQRPQLRGRIEARADLDLAGELGDALHEFLEDRVLDEQPCASHAALAVVEQPGIRRTRDRGLQIGVGEDDVGALSAELQGHLLQVPPRSPDNLLADLGGTRESDLVDVVVRGQLGARVTEPRDDVDDARREAEFAEDLPEQQGGQRRLLGGLEHDGVTGGQRGRDLPCGHQQREVPRDDLPAHADRLAQRVGVPFGTRQPRHRRGDGPALDLRGPARVVVEDVGRPHHVHRLGDGRRLTVVDGLQLAELLGPRQQRVTDLPQQALPLAGGEPAPRSLEGAARRRHRAVDIGGIPVRDLGDPLASRRIVSRERAPRSRRDPLTADQQPLVRRDERPHRVQHRRVRYRCHPYLLVPQHECDVGHSGPGARAVTVQIPDSTGVTGR